jgi:hypothetical protein
MIYQPLNEPNNPVFRIFPTKTTSSAIIVASETIKQHNPDAQVAINILAGLWAWQSDLLEIVRESGSAVDIVGLDYYPGTWTPSPESDAANWNELTDVIAKARKTRTSPLHNRRFGIIETGYATNLRCFRSEQHQVGYFRTLGDALRRMDTSIGTDGLRLIGIHELTDSDTNAFLDPEAHFGLLASDTLHRKPAFDVVRQIFRSVR